MSSAIASPAHTRAPLPIQNVIIPWVIKHKCLGHFVFKNYSHSQLQYALDRTKPRIHALRRLTSTKLGASHYIQAIWSIIDFIAISLLELNQLQIEKKTRDHSKLGHKNDSRSPHMDSPSPHWNPPVLTRTASWPRLSPLKGLSLSSKESLRDSISEKRSLKTECHTAVIKAIKTGNLHTHQNKGTEKPHPSYQIRPPWNKPPTV